MEIENNKEEVPFGHYENLFRQADPAEIAGRTGVAWDGKEFTVKLMGRTYAISHPEYAIREITANCHPEERSDEGSVSCNAKHCAAPGAAGEDGFLPGALRMLEHICAKHSLVAGAQKDTQKVKLPLPTQTFLLRYLLEGKKVASGGNWLTFREMPWGELYVGPYTGRVLTRAAFTFGTRLDAFRAAAEKMGALPLSHGDAGYQFELVDGYDLQILVWAGDEEFPPNAQVLYSDNFAAGFGAEDRVVAGDILISAIKGNM